MVRKRVALVLLLCLVLLSSLGFGCPKDPYRAALQGSDGVSNGVHSAVVTIGQLYSQGVADDAYKASASKYLNEITDCNMTFRKSVVVAHTSKVVGNAAYLSLADAFVKCAQTVAPPTGPASSALKAVDTAINGISLAIQNAKGGS